jgi:hypothetical protein
MNKILIFLLLLYSISVSFPPKAVAQDNAVNEKVTRSIRSGDAKELAKYFNSNIQLILPSDEGRFSRTQAELIVRGFFTRYPPKSFEINHQGSSSDGSKYYIGAYKSGSKTFRSYYLLKQVSDKALIHQLRFEEDD